MKNIKKFINKNLAVFLSLAIIVTTLLPVLSGVVGAASYDAAAIAELKAAWADLTVTYELVPTEVWDGSLSGGVAPLGTGLNVYDSSLYTDADLTDKSVLGSKYATYNVALTGASDWKDYVVYKLADGSVTDFDVTQFKDFSVYVKSASGVLARPRMHISSAATPIAVRWNDPSYFAADVLSTGAWKKVSMSDLSEVNAFINCLTNYSNPTDYKISGLGFDLSKTGATGEFVTGSASLVMSAASATTLALADTDATAFVAAAKTFNDTAVSKNYFAAGDTAYARFTTALAAFEEDADAAKIQDLKTAWSALTVTREFVPAEVWDGTLVNGVAPKGTGLDVYDASTYAGNDLTDKSVLGSKYATYTLTTAGASDWKDYIVFESVGEDASLSVNNLKGYTVYVKSTAETLARPRIYLTNTQQLWNNGSYHDQTAMGTNEWKKLSSADMPEQNKLWTTTSNSNIETTAPIASFGFDFSKLNENTTVTVGTLIATFDAVNADTLALANTDAAAFKAAAKAFYDEAVANSYFAADDTAFTAFKTALNNAMGDAVKIDTLKSAWEALTVETYFIPDTVWSAQNTVGTGLTLNDTSAYIGTDLTDTSVLGPKFATYHSNATGASYFDDYIVFNNQFVGTSLTLDKLKGYSVYMKSSDTMALRPKMHFENGATKWYDFNLYSADQIGVNTWANLKMSDLPQQNNLWASGSSADAVKTSAIKAIGFDLSGIADVTVGSMKVSFNAVNAETLALASSDSESFITAAKSFYTEAVANGYFAADDASFIAFKDALTAVAGDVDQTLNAIALKETWAQLSDITREFVPAEVWDGTLVNGVAPKGTGLDVYEAAAYTGDDLTDKSVLGSKYATYTLTTAGASDWKDYIVFESVGEDASLSVNNLKGYTVYVKSTAETLARPRIYLTNTQQLWNNGSYHDQTAMGTNEWKKLSSADMPEQNKLWTTTSNSNIETTAPIASFGFDFSKLNESTTVTVGTLKATFSAVTDDVLALASTDVDAFMEAAANFYFEAVTNGYYAEDDTAFAAFVEAAKNAGIKFSLSKLVGGIADTWKTLTVTETLVPVTLWNGQSKPVEGLNVYDSSAYAGDDLTDKSVLGPKYATFIAPSVSLDDGNKGNASDWADYVVFGRADGGLTKLPASNYTDFSLYIKTTDGMATRPRIQGQNGMNWNDPSFYEAAKLGNTWKQITSSQLSVPGEFYQKVLSFGDQKLYGFGFDFSGQGEVSVGSMQVNFTAVSNTTLALLETDPVSFLAEAIYFYNDAVKNSTFAADDANFVAFGNAIDAVVSNEALEVEVAIAKLKAAWMGLSDNSTLPKGDTTDWSIADWVYAANRVDISSLSNTEAFVEALANATALRDEIGASFTCNTDSYANYGEAQGDLDNLGVNILLGETADVYYYNGVEKGAVVTPSSESLTDGSFDNAFSLTGLDFTAEGSYVEFVYEFNGAANVSDFVVGLSSNPDLASMNYRIYVANSIEKLFAPDSIVASFYNENGDQIQKFNFDGKPQISGIYVAFRFYGTGTNDLVISELAAYGDVVTYNVVTGAYTTEQMKALGDSLLDNKGVTTYVKSGTGPMTKWEQAGLKYGKDVIVDLDKSTGAGLSTASNFISEVGDEISYYIIFDLKKAYNLEKILLNHADGKYLATGKYEVYASTERSLLTRSESKIISYNNMSDGPNGTSITQLFTAAGKGAVGRFIAFHIIVPVCDYASLTQYRSDLSYPRIYDLGVFGTEYVKPLAEINFLNHVPVDVYRTDAGGNKTTVKEDEYSGDDYKLAYDGDYTVATPIAQNGKNIDFLFNLCANKAINSVKLSTLTENIKGLKVYASETEEGVWDEENCVVNYSGDATSVVSKTFGETPVYARYVRFSITNTASGTFDPTEFEVIGWNTQEFAYLNLMQENAGNASIWLEDKNDYSLTSTIESANEYLTAWNAEPIYGMINAFDGEEGTVADLYGGSLGDKDGNGRVTMNLLLDLGNLMAIDEIEFIAGSSKDYWPSELKFYAGEDDISLFGKDAKPMVVFDEKSNADNGSYSYDFLPEIAQFVRVEIVESTQEYYAKSNMILSIIAEMKVNGLEVVGYTAAEGAAASITDEETGIRVDVVALRDNDVYTTLQDILVVKRSATAEEKKALAAQSAVFGSDIYDIYLLDANGNIISDVEGRDIKVYLPSKLFEGSSDAYVLQSLYGEYTMVDFVTEDDYYIVTTSEVFGLSFAFCEFANIEDETDGDTPTDTGNDVTDDGADETEETEDEEEEEDETSKKKRKKVKVVRKGNGTDISDYLWIIIVVVAVVIVAAGVTLFIILAKKKKKQEEEE